jgi:hypothetical protein
VANEELHAKLIVPDTGPLITLAAADSLDYLLYPEVPVYVPDAFLYEATVKSDALGAQSIAEWVQRHSQAGLSAGDASIHRSSRDAGSGIAAAARSR